jgi:hypothetical protein
MDMWVLIWLPYAMRQHWFVSGVMLNLNILVMIWTPVQHVITEGSDCLEVARDISRDYADSATSSVSNLPVSSEIRPSLPLKGTVPEHADHSIDGVEEECRLRIDFEDFEKARIKVRPSAMREVLFMHSDCLENHFLFKIYLRK